MSEHLVRAEITDAIHRFYYLVDDGKAAETIDLFTPDATWAFGPCAPKPGTLRGPEINAATDARAKLSHVFTRHLVTNLAFIQATKDEVRTRYFLLLFRSDDGARRATPQTVADVSERWALVRGEWKLQARETMPAFYG